LDSIKLNIEFEGNEQVFLEDKNGRYKYIITHGNEDGFEVITKKIINQISKEEIFVGYFDNENKLILDSVKSLIDFIPEEDNWY